VAISLLDHKEITTLTFLTSWRSKEEEEEEEEGPYFGFNLD